MISFCRLRKKCLNVVLPIKRQPKWKRRSWGNFYRAVWFSSTCIFWHRLNRGFPILCAAIYRLACVNRFENKERKRLGLPKRASINLKLTDSNFLKYRNIRRIRSPIRSKSEKLDFQTVHGCRDCRILPKSRTWTVQPPPVSDVRAQTNGRT
jgi:hypothetical protein